MPARKPLLKRILEKVYVDENQCWIFTGGKQSDGYGSTVKFILGKRYSSTTHRVIYRAFKGVIPKGKEIDHLCRVSACCNPQHLEAVTHRENIKRGNALKNYLAYRNAQTHCKRGHEFTEENTQLHKRKNGFSRECKTCNKNNRKGN